MGGTHAVALSSALAGACCFALAAALQHREASAETRHAVAHPRLLWHLAHRPLWLAGIAAALAGGALHVVALAHAPLIFVQPVGVSALVFAIPVSASVGGNRALPRDLLAAAIVAVGLGALLLSVPPAHTTLSPGAASLVVVIVGCGVLTAAAVAVAARASGQARALLLATAGGACFGTVSLLVRVAFTTRETSTLPLVVVGLAALAGVGLVLVQAAYATGAFALPLATVTVIDPLTATALGVALLHEPMPQGSGAAAAAIGAALICGGVAALARSPVQGTHRPDSKTPTTIEKVLQ